MGLQPPTQTHIGWMAGMKRRRKRKGQQTKRLPVTAFTQGLLHCGLGERLPVLPPCRRASPGLPAHCAGHTAGNGRWQRPTDPSQGCLGCGGSREQCWVGSLVPEGAPLCTAKNMRVQACSESAAQIIRSWTTSDHHLALPQFPHQAAISHPSYVNATGPTGLC